MLGIKIRTLREIEDKIDRQRREWTGLKSYLPPMDYPYKGIVFYEPDEIRIDGSPCDDPLLFLEALERVIEEKITLREAKMEKRQKFIAAFGAALGLPSEEAKKKAKEEKENRETGILEEKIAKLETLKKTLNSQKKTFDDFLREVRWMICGNPSLDYHIKEAEKFQEEGISPKELVEAIGKDLDKQIKEHSSLVETREKYLCSLREALGAYAEEALRDSEEADDEG